MQWPIASEGSMPPTMVYDPHLSGSSGCPAQIWIANVDSVLTRGWLAFIGAIGRPKLTHIDRFKICTFFETNCLGIILWFSASSDAWGVTPRGRGEGEGWGLGRICGSVLVVLPLTGHGSHLLPRWRQWCQEGAEPGQLLERHRRRLVPRPQSAHPLLELERQRQDWVVWCGVGCFAQNNSKLQYIFVQI